MRVWNFHLFSADDQKNLFCKGEDANNNKDIKAIIKVKSTHTQIKNVRTRRRADTHTRTITHA